MTPAAFEATYGGVAAKCAAPLGLSPDLCLTQFGVETGWGAVVIGCNLGNIRDKPGSFARYANFDEFVNAYCWTLAHAGDPVGSGTYYAGVRAAASKDAISQMLALGASPWDAGHYNNGRGPGSQLVTYWEQLRMPTLDSLEAQLNDVLLHVHAHSDAMFYGTGTPNADPSIATTAWGAIKGYAALFEARFKALQQPQPAPPPPDISALSAAVAALTARVDVVAGIVAAIKAKTDKDLA